EGEGEGEGGGEGGAVPDGGAGVDAGPGEETVNARWIGGACSEDEDCEYVGGFCLSEEQGFPGGHCTKACDRLCPDREGERYTITFCANGQDGNGMCVARCDQDLLPETGCRPGYGCLDLPRHGQPEAVRSACLPLSGDARPHPLDELQQQLEDVAALAGVAGERVALLDLGNPALPQVASLRGMEAIYPASVIKVVIMVEVEHQVEQGILSLDERFSVTVHDRTPTALPEGDDRPLLRVGDSPTVQELVELMITRSDNTATNVLIDAVGRENATAYMEQLGLPGLRLHRRVYGGEILADPGWDGVHSNTMTALETARLYQLILDGGPGFVSPASRQRMQGLLGRQMLRDGLYQGLPAGVRYLSKTGETSSKKHDSGIVLWEGQRYVVVALLDMTPGRGLPLLRRLGTRLGELLAVRWRLLTERTGRHLPPRR
ncbi:MAG: serine hydrolase, partial [Deltaproteobacteria bacterium]|nr:serine hydrolase [Deltaproteobacteria bacterium]